MVSRHFPSYFNFPVLEVSIVYLELLIVSKYTFPFAVVYSQPHQKSLNA